MSLLTIANNVALEVGFDPPNSVFASADASARQLLALSNREGKILSKRHNWTILQKENVFNTVAGQDSYELPQDFNRFIDGTIWDKSDFMELRGPLTPQLWQHYKSGMGNSASAQIRYRIKRGANAVNRFFIDPVPTVSGQGLVFEYVSADWVINSAGTQTSNAWNDDNDIPLLSEDLLTLGVVWRFLLAKGLDYSPMAAEYEREVTQAIARDGGMATFHLNSGVNVLVSSSNLPSDNFGV